MIRAGYSTELDGVAQASRDAKAWVANLERSERERTGIRTLKVGYNQCRVEYMTHAIGGLSENDFVCAAKCDVLFDL